jgi:hypothetical protein
MQHGRVVEEGAFKVLSTKPGSILSAMITAQQPIEQAQITNELL